MQNFIKKHEWAQQIGAMLMSYYGGAIGASQWSAYLTRIHGGSLTDIVQSRFQNGVTHVVSAYTANFIGHGGTNGAPYFGKGIQTSLAHGVSQGAMTAAQGGRFKDGFIGGFISHEITGIKSTNSKVLDGIINITLSGTASKLAGGSFANGARSAAFVYLYNHGDTSQHTHRTQKEEIQFIKTQKAFGLLDYHMEQHGYQGGNLDLEDAIILQIEITPFKDYLKLGINMLSTYTGPMGPIESLKSLPELKQMTNDKHIYLYSFPNGRDPIVTRK